ncbi:hypothetical protein W97_05716 [Coniosporium apollinis CBS 100218]|uniref:Alpha/beta hydrolase fold-3 domain-containing protein n=1 Tax=Coniosporium apollinis (strain CBS 100218) TaxID=1168221 RepID=R7YWV0_CONA1|nr:uncharacterized protein W97_05716 [Coniosporium apollinis CBS 100218]EON66323.1 hypothetical protein W97_05716 [Coniosporium apollinis CBS 100218]
MASIVDLQTLRRAARSFTLPWEVQWRFWLVRSPWLVPNSILKITSPEGPHPFIVYLPSWNGQHKIPLYVFLPSEEQVLKHGDRGVPVHLDFHGGGFIMGSCLEQAPFCAMLTRERGCVTISVDYRKGPIDQFPAAIEDAEDALAAILDADAKSEGSSTLRKQIEQHWREKSEGGAAPPITLDPGRISISGFSSGGNLALNLALDIHTPDIDWPGLLPHDGPAIPLLLFYPSFDSRLMPHERPRSENMPPPNPTSFLGSIGPVLSPTYLPKEMRDHPRASPGLADTAGLNSRARVFLVLPEIDTLANQSEEWIHNMQNEGHDGVLEVYRARGMRHGWTQFPETFVGKEALEEKRKVFQRTVEFMSEVQDGANPQIPGTGVFIK